MVSTTMARESYVFDPVSGDLVPKHLFRSRESAPTRSALPSPRIMSDSISGGVSQVSGKYHDSRSSLMQDYRDYEARTGQKIEVVGDQTHHIIADATPAAPNEKAIDASIKLALEKHAA